MPSCQYCHKPTIGGDHEYCRGRFDALAEAVASPDAPSLPDEEPHYNCTREHCNGDPGECWAKESTDA